MKKLLFSCIILFGSFGYSQGCSDAGICSIGNSFTSVIDSTKNQIEVGNVFGKGVEDVFYISPYVSYTRAFNEHFSLTTKITYSQASGSFGTRGNIGDAFLIGNYKFLEKNEKQWSTLLGIKIPFTGSNDKINNFSIPLDYQSSLGTYDLFLGADFKYKKWNFNSVIQIPVINSNGNSYFDEYSASNDFPTTNLFERKSDVLFRSMYTFKSKSQKFTYKPNFLFIYHLGNDTYEDIFGKRQEIKNSEGITINANFISNYKINDRNSIEASIAFPVVYREIRPDGLTRSVTLGINYKYSF
ncbi:hypothetical protein G6N05_04175 [Flavobacterium sp. F372]|uniref:Transporter n=1 Tax=Flavobacterium bernardetii TaxID=2813823 RepID=A0ABR7IWB9_9FLAO|nr:hypothetical protein [Flavobacterium bernardetii]MBC5834073.1 hypothetical protein [Flavobacterium bernardetii]NHF69305.1 hypothetical protein [Flavobacterium bernardetii]